MEVTQIAEVSLTYTDLETVDFGAGGQIYGSLEGSVSGDRLSGSLRLTNLAARRPDDVNVPTLRGILTTEDGASVWVELDGIATLRRSDEARVFVTSFRMRSGDERYSWVNTTFAVLEGVLDTVAVGGVARGRVHECAASIS
ncbi:MAG TPA: hypothetical protein VM573_05085 [Actinomycetota bacterium]|nr:hypothetical protein [Actinomycetota bacterium]